MSAAPDRLTRPTADGGVTLASEARDFPAWHRGRPRFSVWAIAVADADVAARLGAVRTALDDLLLPAWHRQPHITVHICGFPVASPTRPDDCAHTQLMAQAHAVAGARPGGFDLQIGAAFTFTSAACLAVQDATHRLTQLRSIVHQAAPGRDTTPYVPHVTAGLYAGAWPLRDVQARLQAIPAAPAIPLRVRWLDWMCYDSRHIAGPLTTLLRVDLDTGQVQVPSAERLRAAFAEAPAQT